MKIGILTFHAALNCGSMLQAFALQEVLKQKYNAEVEIINYSNKGQRQFYSLWDMKLRPNIVKANFKALPHWTEIRKNNAGFENFSKKYLNVSGPLIKKYDGLLGIDEKYDMIISGGDQIWNVKCRDADKAYFLAFVKNAKKVSYAPSLGSIQISKYVNKEEYAKYIDSYDYISVREPNGKKWIEEVADVDIPLAPDPTMVLTKEEWEHCIEIPWMDEKFIFYYGFDFQDEANNTRLMNLSKKVGLPIYIIDRKSWNLYQLERFGFVLYEESGPEAFLKLIKNAQVVIAKSFHGIALSLVFHKNFWSIRNRELKNPNDDRAGYILSRMGLMNRFQILEDLSAKDFFTDIDYEAVEEKQAKLREEAYTYMDSFMKS